MGCCHTKDGNLEDNEIIKDSGLDPDRYNDMNDVSDLDYPIRRPYIGYESTENVMTETQANRVQSTPLEKPRKEEENLDSLYFKSDAEENGNLQFSKSKKSNNKIEEEIKEDNEDREIELEDKTNKNSKDTNDSNKDLIQPKSKSREDIPEVDTNKENDLSLQDKAKESERPNYNYHKDSEYSTMKRNLMLTILESKHNPVGKYIIITPEGIKGSDKKSTVVNFGLHSRKYNNDIYFKPEEGISERHFTIMYDKDLNSYCIKNFDNSGVYIKIEDKHILNDDSIFTFGGNHLLTHISSELDGDNEVSIISFEVIFGPNQGKT